jgi:hypothetical protein
MTGQNDYQFRGIFLQLGPPNVAFCRGRRCESLLAASGNKDDANLLSTTPRDHGTTGDDPRGSAGVVRGYIGLRYGEAGFPLSLRSWLSPFATTKFLGVRRGTYLAECDWRQCLGCVALNRQQSSKCRER